MKRSGFTLISMLATVAIICILMVVMMQGYGGVMGTNSAQQPARKDGRGTTTMGAATLSAEDQVCKSNLNQIRMALTAAKMSGEDVTSIKDAGLPDSIYYCPVGHEQYTYDPATGRVSCPHPGHENF